MDHCKENATTTERSQPRHLTKFVSLLTPFRPVDWKVCVDIRLS